MLEEFNVRGLPAFPAGNVPDAPEALVCNCLSFCSSLTGKTPPVGGQVERQDASGAPPNCEPSPGELDLR